MDRVVYGGHKTWSGLSYNSLGSTMMLPIGELLIAQYRQMQTRKDNSARKARKHAFILNQEKKINNRANVNLTCN